MRSQYIMIKDPTLGWGERASKSIKVYDIPGNHYTMLRHPNVPELARLLRNEIGICQEQNSKVLV